MLVIEDHGDSARALSLSLQRRGHTVEVAASGTAGLETALSFAPEVVVCDLALPDIDGLEVARRIRREERLRNVRLIALTAYFVPALAHEAGFDEYVTKPADLDALAQRLLEPPAVR